MDCYYATYFGRRIATCCGWRLFGFFSDVIDVYGSRGGGVNVWGSLWDFQNDNPGDDGGGDSDGGGNHDDEVIVVTAPAEPDRCVANPVTIVFDSGTFVTPNNATYYAPEDWREDDYFDAVTFLQQFGGPDPDSWLPDELSDHWLSSEFRDRLQAFLSVYTDPDDPNYLDFKDWGTPQGPDGTVSGGLISYFSPAEGRVIETSPFEAFGNFIFGYMAAAAGFSNFEARIIAAVSQGSTATSISGIIAEVLEALASGEGLPSDDSRDDPHVIAGFDTRVVIASDSSAQIVLRLDTCSSSSDAPSNGGSGLSNGAVPPGVNFN